MKEKTNLLFDIVLIAGRKLLLAHNATANVKRSLLKMLNLSVRPWCVCDTVALFQTSYILDAVRAAKSLKLYHSLAQHKTQSKLPSTCSA